MSAENHTPAAPAPQLTDRLTDYRLTMIEKTLVSISDSLHQLASLEQKHSETRDGLGRAFTQLDNQNNRLRDVELELPTLKLVRGWIIAGVIGVFGILGISLFRMVLGH